MHGARSVPPPNENEQANKEVEKPDNALVIFNGSGLVREDGDKMGLKFLAIAN
jgi:hypothetical protein